MEIRNGEGEGEDVMHARSLQIIDINCALLVSLRFISWLDSRETSLHALLLPLQTHQPLRPASSDANFKHIAMQIPSKTITQNNLS